MHAAMWACAVLQMTDQHYHTMMAAAQGSRVMPPQAVMTAQLHLHVR